MSKARQPQRLSHRISKIVNRHQLQSLGLTSLMALATGVMVMVATSLIFTATAGAQFSKSPSLAVPGQAASGLDLPEIRWQDAQGNPDLPDAQNTTIVDQVKTVQHIQNRPDAVGLKGLLDALDSPHQLTRRKAAHALARQIIDQYRS
ncbi:MAG: hypothetical protein KC462_00370 [Cyanobacteria bacterium HKST-UBA05]|nr:hypothetical protein [Cyanobacteria bacterium HKST-UBA05]